MSLKDDVIRLRVTNDILNDRLREKDELIDKLLMQVNNLQEALMAKEAPGAWHKLQSDRALAEVTPEQREDMERADRARTITGEYLRMMEEPRLLRDKEDLNSLFLDISMEATEPGPLHDNSES